MIRSAPRSALRRRFRPPRSLTITGAGRTYLVITLGVGLGALNTGNNLLYLVLGLMLSMIVVSGVLSEQCLRWLEVRRLGAEAAFVDEPFAFRYAVKRSRGTGCCLVITEEGAAVSGEARVAVLPSGEEQVARADLRAPRRGPHALTGIKVTTVFPLGLFAKTRVFESEAVLLVYPRRVAHAGALPDQQAGPVGDTGNPRRRDGTGDLLGLRDLRDGEDVRQVHWKKSASAGKLLRTERAREERRQFTLALDPTLAPDPLERRLEEAAAQARALLERGHEVGLDAGLTRLRPAAGPGQERRILCALAWVGHEERR